jgi:O-methyltransferase
MRTMGGGELRSRQLLPPRSEVRDLHRVYVFASRPPFRWIDVPGSCGSSRKRLDLAVLGKEVPVRSSDALRASCSRDVERAAETREPSGVMRQLFVMVVNAVWSAWARTPVASAGGALIERVPDGRVARWIDVALQASARAAWWQPALRARLSAGRDRPLVPTEALEATYRDVLATLVADGVNEAGAYLEFGVYVGTSLLCMHRASIDAGMSRMRLVGFDSFEGLPASADSEDGGAFRRGWYRAGQDVVRDHLTRNGIDWDRTTLVPGWFEETLCPSLARELGIDRASVILIDCDVYPSARAALRFCAPLIRDRAVIVFDDWSAGRGTGERRAFGEFMAEHAELEAYPVVAPHDDAAVFVIERRARYRSPHSASST